MSEDDAQVTFQVHGGFEQPREMRTVVPKKVALMVEEMLRRFSVPEPAPHSQKEFYGDELS
jgi:hypothetical protein